MKVAKRSRQILSRKRQEDGNSLARAAKKANALRNLNREMKDWEPVSTDYALQEYGLNSREMAAAERRIEAELKTARKRGEVTRFATGEMKPDQVLQ